MSARQAERRFVRFVVVPVLQGGLGPFRGLDAPRAQNQLYFLACGEVNGQLAITPIAPTPQWSLRRSFPRSRLSTSASSPCAQDSKNQVPGGKLAMGVISALFVYNFAYPFKATCSLCHSDDLRVNDV